MVNNPELINKMINNINKLDDETIKQAIKEVEKEDMEEDIKILEEMIEDLEYKHKTFGLSDKYYKTLERFLKRYKELEEENKELLEVRVSASAHTRIIELEEENKNQKEALNQANKKILAQKGQLKVFNEKQFIPISVIQNKIDELKKHIIDSRSVIETITGEKSNFEILTEIKMSALQELLEERE